VEATAEVSKTFNEKIRKYCDMTLLSCAYAGTGNVLKVIFQTHFNHTICNFYS
jgi:26S proteasome regulatory subunit N1